MGISAGFVCTNWTEVKEERRRSISFTAGNLGYFNRIGPVFIHSDSIKINLEINQQELYSLFSAVSVYTFARELNNKVTFKNNPVSCKIAFSAIN